MESPNPGSQPDKPSTNKTHRWDEIPTPTKRERARYDKIHAELRAARQRGESVSSATLAAKLKVSRQTISSDIANLQNDYSMPIEVAPDRSGYRYTEDVVDTPFCKLSEKEVFSLYLSHEMLAAFQPLPLKHQAQSAHLKIMEQAGDNLSFDAAMAEDCFTICGRTLASTRAKIKRTLSSISAQRSRV